MQFTSEHPRGNYKFYDQSVTLPHVFAPGHALTEPEARFINQQVATAVGNRYGAKVRRALAEIDAERAKAHKAKEYTGPMDEKGKNPAPATVADLGWDHQAAIEALFSEFEPGVAMRGTGEPTDPLEAEVRRLAGIAVRDKYKEKGIKYNAMLEAKHPDGRSAYSHHIDAYIDAKGDTLRTLAQNSLDAQKALKGDVDIDLSAPKAAAE